jgi:hypothetical protein
MDKELKELFIGLFMVNVMINVTLTALILVSNS